MMAPLAVSGCAWWGPKTPEVPEATLPTWAGRIAMVDTAHRFALVDTGAPMVLPTGANLISFRGKQRTATLVVTPEARPPYLAVEIVEGMPALGDQVALDEGRSVTEEAVVEKVLPAGEAEPGGG